MKEIKNLPRQWVLKGHWRKARKVNGKQGMNRMVKVGQNDTGIVLVGVPKTMCVTRNIWKTGNHNTCSEFSESRI